MSEKITDAEYDKKTARAKHDFEIFVDMDGVLTDFDGHARANGKFNEKGQPKWDELDYKWWVTMPAYPGMKGFYNELKGLGDVAILTAPAASHECVGAKAEWVVKQWGKWSLKDLFIAPAARKCQLARPNRILIDDREKNVKEWTEAGGIGILHTGDYADTLRQVREAIAGYEAKHGKPAPAKKAVRPKDSFPKP